MRSPARGALDARGKFGSASTSAIHAGSPLAHTRPGRPSPRRERHAPAGPPERLAAPARSRRSTARRPLGPTGSRARRPPSRATRRSPRAAAGRRRPRRAPRPGRARRHARPAGALRHRDAAWPRQVPRRRRPNLYTSPTASVAATGSAPRSLRGRGVPAVRIAGRSRRHAGAGDRPRRGSGAERDARRGRRPRPRPGRSRRLSPSTSQPAAAPTTGSRFTNAPGQLGGDARLREGEQPERQQRPADGERRDGDRRRRAPRAPAARPPARAAIGTAKSRARGELHGGDRGGVAPGEQSRAAAR